MPVLKTTRSTSPFSCSSWSRSPNEFSVPLTEVAVVFYRHVVAAARRRAPASGWLADRVGRKTPLMISIFWYSVCNFIAGFSPTLLFLLVLRHPARTDRTGPERLAARHLAMEQWPIRSRGFMSGVLQGSWSIGLPAVESVIWAVLGDHIGWRGMPPCTAYCRPSVATSATSSKNHRSGSRTAAVSWKRSARFAPC